MSVNVLYPVMSVNVLSVFIYKFIYLCVKNEAQDVMGVSVLMSSLSVPMHINSLHPNVVSGSLRHTAYLETL